MVYLALSLPPCPASQMMTLSLLGFLRVTFPLLLYGSIFVILSIVFFINLKYSNG